MILITADIAYSVTFAAAYIGPETLMPVIINSAVYSVIVPVGKMHMQVLETTWIACAEDHHAYLIGKKFPLLHGTQSGSPERQRGAVAWMQVGLDRLGAK